MGKTRVKALKFKEGALPVDALNDKVIYMDINNDQHHLTITTL